MIENVPMVYSSAGGGGGQQGSHHQIFVADHDQQIRETPLQESHPGGAGCHTHVGPNKDGAGSVPNTGGNGAQMNMMGSAGCPKHGNGVTTRPRSGSSVKQIINQVLGGGEASNPDPVPQRKFDAKEIMKKRREKAICIDRVSRILFPCTFILLNIGYWLVFSDIIEKVTT